MNSGDRSRPAVVALTDTRKAGAAQGLAFTLAELWAKQGQRTILVHADGASCPDGTEGYVDVLGDSSWINRFDDVLRDGAVTSMKVLPAGSVVADRSMRVTRERICALFDQLRSAADTIVVAAPSIADSTEAQLICAAADRTVLVAARGKSHAGDVTAAAEALAKAHAVVLGAVLVEGSSDEHVGSRLTRRSAPVGSQPERTNKHVSSQGLSTEKVLTDSSPNRHP